MKKSLLFSLLFILCLQVIGQQNSLRQELNTTINVTLNAKERSLEGFLKLEYTNHSSDTLNYIWFQLWPNAFKSDRTAFSDYFLEKGRTDFYFSDKEKRGYINRLDFRTNDNVLKQEDHLQHIDIIKVILDKPLVPGMKTLITTPFHVKLPYNFDGIGYSFNEYNIKFWYPAPAIYSDGTWHPLPYTGAGSSLNEKSNFDVTISLPLKYHITASGKLMDSLKIDSLKTLRYTASNIEDFSFRIEKFRGLSGLPKNKNFGEVISKQMPKILSHPILPVIGYNNYDGLQAGLFVHNLKQPSRQFSYFAAPLFAFNSKKIIGIGGIRYMFQPTMHFKEIEAGLNASTFSTMDGVDTNGNKVFANVYKVAPYLRMKFPTLSSKTEKSLEFKSFIIGERDLDYVQYSFDSFYYPARGNIKTRYVNQLSFNYASHRALYPYNAQLQLQQGSNFYRINATGRYFLNYPKGGGMRVRLFAAKFGYIGNISSSKQFETIRYQPKLTAVRGSEDYTYNDYFIGRNDFEGFSSHQIMMRDGGLKLRTDLFQDLQGRSENWIASMNLNSTLPKLLPVAIPLRVFLDAGTYAEAWKSENSDPRFLYVAGIQLSLFKEILNIYAPLLFSKQFRDRLKSVPEENKFFRRISFSIDIQCFLNKMEPLIR